MPKKIKKELIAVCGVNCQACSAFLNKKKPCPGCRAPEAEHGRKSCRNCSKKSCAFGKGFKWCFECDKFPCSRIKSMNRRYVENYGIDLVQNGFDAKKDMNSFLTKQRERFICSDCGGVIDQHRQKCSNCGA